jgi:endonuclease YncB( thermonuclease family)
MKLFVLAASLMLAALPAFAESVRVIDGDTLKIDGVTYRLWGIDAPESGQPCADGWAAGRAACVYRKLDSASTQGTNGVSSGPDDRSA